METQEIVQHWHVYGPGFWQLALLMLGAGLAACWLDRASVWIQERTLGAGRRVVGRVRRWWADRPGADVVEDALAGDGRPVGRAVEPARGFVAERPAGWREPRARWAVTSTKLHRADCVHAQGAGATWLTFVETVEEARPYVDEDGRKACADCDPLELEPVEPVEPVGSELEAVSSE